MVDTDLVLNVETGLPDIDPRATHQQLVNLLAGRVSLALFRHLDILWSAVEIAGGAVACDRAGARWMQVSKHTFISYLRDDAKSKRALRAFLYTRMPPQRTMFMSDEERDYVQMRAVGLPDSTIYAHFLVTAICACQILCDGSTIVSLKSRQKKLGREVAEITRHAWPRARRQMERTYATVVSAVERDMGTMKLPRERTHRRAAPTRYQSTPSRLPEPRTIRSAPGLGNLPGLIV
jgi:hypothetical protein